MKSFQPLHLLLSIAILCLWASTLYAQDQNKSSKKAKKISLLDRLLMEDLPQLEIQTNVNKVFEDWRHQNYHWGFAKISLDEKEVITEEIKVRVRGKYRSRFCENPPMKIKFSKDDLKDRNLKKWNDFKLVYPCRSPEQYQTYVLKEYLVYKLYNVLTEYSLRVQLVDLILSDSAAAVAPQKFNGFLIEDREEFIKRTQAVTGDMKCMAPNQLDNYSYTLFQVFQFMIGNTDWLLPTCKNAEIVAKESGEMIPIPYDFDFSGMVAAEYSSVDIALGINNVTERYFMGHHKSLEELAPVLALFQNKKEALIQVIDSFEYLPRYEKKTMIKYLKSFYKIIDKPQNVIVHFVHTMPDIMAKDY